MVDTLFVKVQNMTESILHNFTGYVNAGERKGVLAYIINPCKNKESVLLC